MKRLALVICNYNKQEYVLKCIESALASTYVDFDIYVVDNASSDDSIKLIRQNFNDEVILIVNKENKGGSGGFNTGIREALKKDYKYIMLLDNDVVLEENAIKASLEYLEEQKNVAVVGSKIYSMDNPNQIQELGAKIDFQNYLIMPFYKGHIDNEYIPEIIECDYVPACSMMLRVSAIEKVGLMAEENFIYWDDIDWGYRFRLNGYKVVALSKSIVWHKMGVAQKKNTFGTYYFWRNKIKFFMTYCNLKQKEEFSQILFEELFQSIYMCNYIGKYNSAVTILHAALDAVNCIYGKANDNRIIDVDNIESKFENILNNTSIINIIDNTNINHIRNIVNKALQINDHIKINIVSDETDIKEQFRDSNISIVKDINLIDNDGIIFITCNHILKVDYKGKDGYVYIDKYFNVIYDEKDREYVYNYAKEKELFKNVFYPILVRGIKDGSVYKKEGFKCMI